MKYLTQLLEAIKNEDLPEIYCDLDEVLVDFLRAADAAVSGSFAKTDKKTRWNIINQTKGFGQMLVGNLMQEGCMILSLNMIPMYYLLLLAVILILKQVK